MSDPAPTPIHNAFDPSKYLSRVNGNEYLGVKYRLAWLRDRHPDAEIVTEMIEYQPGFAIFKATVTLPTGGTATGHGSESVENFKDHIEKAETAAIGRALAALGFGTQFCHDHEDGAPRRPVDAPVPIRHGNRQPPPQRAQASRPPAAPPPAPSEEYGSDPPDDPMSEKQRGYLERLAHERGMDLNALDAVAEQRFGVAYQWLGRQDASALITYLQQIPVP